MNLDNIVSQGAGIRIPINKWNTHNIQSAVNSIIKEPAYKENIKVLKNILNSIDGKKNSAPVIWDYIIKKLI
ncbi:UDP-glucosyl transferase [Clostridium tyrobutyricum]|uniref:UDP-glucosyl transferase n=1 Tax=Clostridium tyrobutyricum TaxID=1519 RepID=UPI0010AAD215